MGRVRRTFSSEEKLKKVMAIIEGGKAVSDVAQKFNLHPNMLLNWEKEFLENAASSFDRHRPNLTGKPQQKKIELLESQIQKKNNVIAKIAEENIMLKKTFVDRNVKKHLA